METSNSAFTETARKESFRGNSHNTSTLLNSFYEALIVRRFVRSVRSVLIVSKVIELMLDPIKVQ